MKYRFTPASERALAYASQWTSRTGHQGELRVQSLLLGLLLEPECRAATILTRLAVDSAAVRRRWPDLEEEPTQRNGYAWSKPLASDVEYSLQIACQRLADLPQPPELATEQLLWGWWRPITKSASGSASRGSIPTR